MDYKSSGVDVEKADRLISWIKRAGIKQAGIEPAGPGRPGGGGPLLQGSDYASLLPFPARRYKAPVLAASADGVGTKLKLAAYFSDWRGIGQDLAAMCLNDLLCAGAKPLFFLDYYACGVLDLAQAKSFLKGLQKACAEAGCPLAGGETAELPGLYKSPDIDCAGFAAGVVERDKILGPHRVREGDEIIALSSSGFHSNGYSLLRQIYKTPEDLQSRRRDLMRPTRLYTFLAPFLDKIKGLRAMAHITGGGLDNISRIIPPGLKAELRPWKIPPLFLEARERAGLSWESLLKTFNCGLGMVIVLKDGEELLKSGAVSGRKGFLRLGRVASAAQKKAPGPSGGSGGISPKSPSKSGKRAAGRGRPPRRRPAAGEKAGQGGAGGRAKLSKGQRPFAGAGGGWFVDKEALQRKSQSRRRQK